jgi:formamidopyrimidine-DNA glycosylase
MMWGRWQTFGPQAGSRTNSKRSKPLALPGKDRRERARIVAGGGAAILLSAPIFNVGAGDPYDKVEILQTLGPDVLPYSERFDDQEFQRRLLSPEYHSVEIGAALLNQQIIAGLGNYLRAEVLFVCKLNPWLRVSELSKRDLKCLTSTIPRLAHAAYRLGATALEQDRNRMAADSTLVYQQGREYGTRHMVFRRTNLPCLRCGERIKQLRQKTHNALSDGDEERTRIMYFCTKCQKVRLE